MDAGAASKFYHVVWNNPEEYKRVIIHLGDFHGLMEFFGVIGKIIQGSGFEEIVYEAGLCTSGGIKGVLTGKHYNRSWVIHECFAEAIERLFVEKFLEESQEQLLTQSSKGIQSEADCEAIFSDSGFKEQESEYNQLKQLCLQGKKERHRNFG